MKILATLTLLGAVTMMTLTPALAAPQRSIGGGMKAKAGVLNANRSGGMNRPVGVNINPNQVRAVANSSLNRGGYNNGFANRPGRRPNVVVVNNGGRPGGYGNGYNNGYTNGYNNNNWQNNRDDGDNFGEFIGKTAAITAGVAVVTAIAKSGNTNKNTSANNTTVNGQECEQQISNGQVYVNCNGTWYQPVQMGTQTNYQQSQAPR